MSALTQLLWKYQDPRNLALSRTFTRPMEQLAGYVVDAKSWFPAKITCLDFEIYG